MYEVGVARSFQALHRIADDVGPAGELHGHAYRVEVIVRGEALDPDGMLLNIDVLTAAVSECLVELDATELDELPLFEGHATTVEMVAAHIWEHVRAQLAESGGIDALRVTVLESSDAWASIDRPWQA